MKKHLFKKLIAPALILLLGSIDVIAQTPMYFNTNLAGGQNSIPFSSGAQLVWRRAQFCMPANSLGSVAPGNNITKVYFMAGSTANVTYPNFTVRLKTAAPTGMQGVTNGAFEPGMTTVFTAVNFNMVTVSGAWYAITLQTPFLYDPTFPLIVDFEQDHANAVGPTVMQPGNITLSGSNGRQWGNNLGAPINGVGPNQLNFGIDVIPATPCTTAPPSNAVTPATYTTCPGLINPTLNVAATYSFGGITYQWQSSTVSAVGPYFPVPGYTLSTAPVPTINVTTWYQLVATCTNISTNNSTTLTGTQIFVAGQTSSVVPYFEDFENVQMANRLPNCSWSASSLGLMNQSSVVSGSGNRVPRSGQKFASFNNSPVGTSYYYTNPIQMNSGITYSAALWYATEYFGYNNWTNLSILVGTSQTPTGLVQIASIGPAVSGPYKLLDGTFTVPSSGPYYIAIKATSASGSAQYLSWDDLSVTIPCTPESNNTSTVILSASSNTICQGDQIQLTASGADTFLWYDGTTASTLVTTPMTTTILTVAGTNTLTNCITISNNLIVVDPSPTVIAISDKYSVCPGQSAYLTAYGADNYIWQGNGPGNVILVKPTTTTNYTVQGTNTIGCSMEAVVSISVMPQPTVNAVSQSLSGESCMGDMVTFDATGNSTSYTWYSNTSPIMLQGQSVNVILQQSTTYTVVGKGANTCTNQATVSQVVNTCVGLHNLQAGSDLVKLFPNPTNGVLQLDLLDSGLKNIEISDVSGRLVYSQQTSESTLKLDISTLAPGVYNATVKSENTTYSSRLIKN